MVTNDVYGTVPQRGVYIEFPKLKFGIMIFGEEQKHVGSECNGKMKVYKGYIDDGSTIVAVKRLNPKSNQGADEFWTEIEMLSQLWYTYLVALIEYCNDCNEMILVYEYIAHGTLADHLYKISTGGDGIGLTWDQRLNIFIGAARRLDYLDTGT
ncbi:probable receptor-like protein kinase At5g38990 [Camellia sinensis]|uniref:probable receptor-like protein kinase At5g38990 n=1 Tax=Camellia sinensis TaxID=4442 RepID=UPI001035FA22|nr:probable receptor-like protein kinase At5g38990 [Camellia sinensis]